MLRRLLDRILRPKVVGVDITYAQPDEPDIEAAKAAARETLPIFWRVFEAGTAEFYQLKVGLTTEEGGIEHIWLEPSGWSEGKVVGRLMNEPMGLGGLIAGSEIVVDPERVSDWGYARNGQLYGAFTQRAMLSKLNPKFRRKVEAALSPTPLEDASA